jgi:hypothetical protein
MIATTVDQSTAPTTPNTTRECAFCPTIEVEEHMDMIMHENKLVYVCADCGAPKSNQ